MGAQRKDGLKCVECTIFHNETRFRSSDLIRDAVGCLLTWAHALDVDFPDGIITGVNTEKTAGGRASDAPAGICFREAGFEPFEKKKGRADVWLRYAGPGFGGTGPAYAIAAPQSERLLQRRA